MMGPPGHYPNGRTVGAGFAIVSAGILLACNGGSSQPSANRRQFDTSVLVHDRAPASDAFRTAVRAALPALAFVQIEALPTQPSRGPFEIPYWRNPPGEPDSRPKVGSGSGVVLDSSGYVLTNNHVVENATSVMVVLSDKRRAEATVVGRDPDTDIAVLKVEMDGLRPARLGNSDSLQVGDWVLALGYPLGLSATVTAGIVSATGRSLGIVAENSEATAPLEYFIQTDAAINPGNSGGPLVDLAGRVVGVNTAIASPTGYYSGYGFAVPINLALRVADDLIRFGEVRRPRLGVQIAEVTPADAEVYGLQSVEGAEVVAVDRSGPAVTAGVQLGDVVVAVDSLPVDTPGELQALVARRRPGDTVLLRLVRYGEAVTLSVVLGRFPSRGRPDPPSTHSGRAGLGFAIARTRDGIAVSEVAPYSPAMRAGVRPGQRILAANGRQVRSVSDFKTSLEALPPGAAISLRVFDAQLGETIINYRPQPAHERSPE